MKHSIWKRTLSMLLAVVLVTGLVPASAFAAAAETVAPAAETVVTVSTAAELPAEIPAGTVVELAADITLSAEQQITALAGTLDGKGHTITVAGKPLAQELTGTIQNLILDSTVTIAGEMFGPSFGSMAVRVTGGSILNSATIADMQDNLNDMGCLVGESFGGTIRNSFYGGAATGMMYGGLVGVCVPYTQENPGTPSTILNSYFTSATGPVSQGAHFNKEDGSFGAKSLEEMQAPEFADLLNTDLPDTGFVWQAVPGSLPRLVEAGSVDPEEKPGVSTAALEAAIAEAEALTEADYTPETWQAVQTALEAARAALAKQDLTQEQANTAAADLRNAIKGLKKPMPTQPVELPSEGVIQITSADQLNWIMDPAETAGKYYRLENDITISGFWVSNMAGVFDGNGHTVTIEGASPLFDFVTETGVVQNVNFVGTTDQEIGAAANRLQGAVVNCRSSFSGKAAGLATELDGGVIANALVVGNAEKGALVKKYRSGQVVNTWWPENLSNSIPAEAMTNSGPLPVKEMKTTALRDNLNAGRGGHGTQWGQGADGYPYFGADQHYVPEGAFENLYPVSFTPVEGEKQTVQGELVLNPDETSVNLISGTFHVENLPEGSRIEWDCDDQNKGNSLAINRKTGELYVYGNGAAIVTATEFLPDGSHRKAAVIEVRAAEKEIEAVHLFIDGQDVTGGSYTVAGSEDGNIQVKVQYAGEDTLTPAASSRFTFVPSSTEMIHNIETSGIFRFKKPGTATMTVTARNGKSAQVELTSTYVPVASITPSVSGVNVLHGKNSMYYNYNTLETQVIITPANASYQDNYTVSSSNEEIAYFSYSLPLGYIPCRDGKVTFTAQIVNVDPETGAETLVTGSSEATFVYRNPLTSVTGPEKVSLTAYEEPQLLDLHFTGANSQDGWAVTETRLDWSFSGTGKVKITYPNKVMQIRDENLPDHGNWVSNTEYFVQGIKAGTVVATGTPVDQSGGAQPVVITFEVAEGNGPAAFDTDKFVQNARMDSADYLVKTLGYTYGEEWPVFTLLRAGESLPQADLDRYYDNVVAEVRTWNSYQKPTDIARVALALSAMEKDITNVGGVNLAAMLYNHPALETGSNEVCWALIALDARETVIPADAKWSRTQMLDTLVTFQNADGGFALGPNGNSGIDTTAMALQALAPYPAYQDAIDKGMAYLKKVQTADFDTASSEAIAQTIITLSVLGRNAATDPDFNAEDEGILHALSLYYAEGEGFRHDKNQKVNLMATVQAMQALESYQRLLDGKNGYWTLVETAPETNPDTDPDANPDPEQKPETDPNKPEKPVYRFTSGENQKVVKTQEQDGITLTLDAERIQLTGVLVDGNTLPTKYYTVEGALQITLHKAYLETLEVGTHRITVELADGSVTTRLFVEEAPVKPDPQKDKTVSFILYGDAHHGTAACHTYRNNRDQLPVWVSAQVTVPENATVLTVLEKALRGAGLSWVNRGGYIATVNGLSEFDNGPLSGWMYLLNGVYPLLGVAEQSVNDGDSIVFHYTDDYTQERTGFEGADAAVEKVQDLIDAIGTVNKNSAAKIQAARKAYDALSAAQQAKVKNYAKLTTAEQALAKLTATKEDLAAAEAVQDLIDAIGAVNQTSGEKIAAARKAYNELTELQQQLVENYDTLLLAEKQFAQLDSAPWWELYRKVGDSLEALANKQTPVVDSVGGEWLVLGLVRSGRTVPDAYYENVRQYVAQHSNENEQLHKAKASDNARVILALTALGKDVTNVDGHNLLMGLTDLAYVKNQGINGPIWALIALDTKQYEIPANPKASVQVTRENLLDEILNAQLPDGGWALGGSKSDADMTGMALQALAPYTDDARVRTAVDKALVWASAAQEATGGFYSHDGSSVESTAQMLVALSALGIDADTDARFIKKGNSVVDGLVSFAKDDGFSHVPGGKRDQMATEQGYYALAAYDRFTNHKNSLYDMTDVEGVHAHTYTWTITKLATAEAPGTLEGRCDCGDVHQKELPVVGTSGKVTVVAGADNQFDAAMTDALALGVTLTDAEMQALVGGADLTITYTLRDAAALLDDAERAALPAEAVYLELTLTKQIADNAPVAVHALTTAAELRMTIPAQLAQAGEQFQLVMLADGKAQAVPCTVDSASGTVTFAVEAEGVFALTAAETAQAQAPASNGSSMPVVVTVSILVVLAAVLWILWRKKHMAK